MLYQVRQLLGLVMDEEEKENILQLVRTLSNLNEELSVMYVFRNDQKCRDLSMKADDLLKDVGFQWRDGQICWKETEDADGS